MALTTTRQASVCYLFLAISLVSPLYAAPQLEEVIVTAQKREQNLQDVPMGITALDSQLLEANEINSLMDLTKLVPSLKLTPGDDPTNDSIRIRGVGTNVFSSAVEPNVSVVIDGVPLARTSMANFDFADIQRVEVLRGPQGTLFGKNASAGLVHIITRDPATEFEGRLRASYERPDNYPGDFLKTQFSISGPLTSNLGARLTGFFKQRNGHLEDIAQNEKLPDSEQFGARGKLQWDPTDTLALRLSLEYQRLDGHSMPFVRRNGNPTFVANNPDIEFNEHNRKTRTFGNNRADTINQAATVTLDWDLSDYIVTSVTGLRTADIERAQGAPDLDGERIDLVINGGERTLDTFTQELRLTSPGGRSVEYTVGALWFYNELYNVFNRRVEDIPTTFVANLPNPPDISDLVLGADTIIQRQGIENTVDTENLGIFGQGTWHVTERWHLTAGLRYINEKVTTAFSTFTGIDDGATETQIDEASTSAMVSDTSIRDEALTGTASVQYDWGDHSTLYTTISKGYRGATFDVTVSSDQDSADNPIDPEIAKSFEVGIKSRLFDNRLEINTTAFITKFEDFQAQLIDINAGGFAAEFKLDNAGELETRGIEVDFKARPLESLTLFGSVLFNRAVFNEFVTQCFSGQGPNEGGAIDLDDDGSCDANDVAGGTLPNAPKLSASLTARYDHPMNDAGNIYTQINGRWQDDVSFSSDQHPLTRQEAYDIWNLRFGWSDRNNRLELSAYVHNLFEQNYAASVFGLSLVNDRRDILHHLTVDSDRIFGVSLAYEF